MYEYLHYPVLTPGRSPSDACSFPIPHVYFFYAIIGSHAALLQKFGTVATGYASTRLFVFETTTIHASHIPHTRHDVWHAKQMAQVLGGAMTDLQPWQEKVPKAIYRGSCYPTANPDADDKNTYLFLRGAVCQASTRADTSLFDVGRWVVWVDTCMLVCTCILHEHTKNTLYIHRHGNRPRVRPGCSVSLLHGCILWKTL